MIALLPSQTGGVVDITDDFKRDWVLRNTEVKEVWGIGRKMTASATSTTAPIRRCFRAVSIQVHVSCGGNAAAIIRRASARSPSST